MVTLSYQLYHLQADKWPIIGTINADAHVIKFRVEDLKMEDKMTQFIIYLRMSLSIVGSQSGSDGSIWVYAAQFDTWLAAIGFIMQKSCAHFVKIL